MNFNSNEHFYSALESNAPKLRKSLYDVCQSVVTLEQLGDGVTKSKNATKGWRILIVTPSGQQFSGYSESENPTIVALMTASKGGTWSLKDKETGEPKEGKVNEGDCRLVFY